MNRSLVFLMLVSINGMATAADSYWISPGATYSVGGASIPPPLPKYATRSEAVEWARPQVISIMKSHGHCGITQISFILYHYYAGCTSSLGSAWIVSYQNACPPNTPYLNTATHRCQSDPYSPPPSSQTTKIKTLGGNSECPSPYVSGD